MRQNVVCTELWRFNVNLLMAIFSVRSLSLPLFYRLSVKKIVCVHVLFAKLQVIKYLLYCTIISIIRCHWRIKTTEDVCWHRFCCNHWCQAPMHWHLSQFHQAFVYVFLYYVTPNSSMAWRNNVDARWLVAMTIVAVLDVRPPAQPNV